MKPPIISSCRPRRLRHAFSLVEVVLAVGVVGVALLSIMAMLPTGIMAVQNAETMQATSNIAEQLRGQLQLLSFPMYANNANSIQNLYKTTYYYTTDGTQVTTPTTTPYNYYYQATFMNYPIGTAAGSTAVVTSAYTPNINNIQNVVVTLTYPPGVNNQTYTFSLLIGRQTDN